ncbi:hypothetical protein BOW53_00515 [Solemya pervernicosa gill symbiont]|uniref:YtkA-like domain-containing protein n=2 Tax=Gammaproteobacteria incertae sedis TaxID=118884 RepID=A0A1T2LB77_9GAMM|nr:hypothetical protein [Candidatus Reidiella endopervernicosa]OOZ42355.1 hypothetical protein BOW53_00515 [Solemya pervernicosa gill symbiont]QKQ25745.1 hypothetical protein HUE57_05175 [Candidatus Reidiella endopervernicosa]
MTLNKNMLWGGVIALLIAVAAVAFVKGRHLLEPQLIATAELIEECDLNLGSCSSSLADFGAVSLTIAPHPIPVIKPLSISVQSDIPGIESLMVDISGLNMNMGLNRFPLLRQSDGSYRGDGMLPVCTRNLMRWQAKVIVQTDAGLVAFPFNFETLTNR